MKKEMPALLAELVFVSDPGSDSGCAGSLSVFVSVWGGLVEGLGGTSSSKNNKLNWRMGQNQLTNLFKTREYEVKNLIIDLPSSFREKIFFILSYNVSFCIYPQNIFT